ncbi:DUF6089 family protein [Pontimicrobium sp. SW4]|uniref:DUF6089 family protein n=1 Tax=Pontimicrobium sp. SW4 TaxID=3153519 RepID=A0AAU7BRL2_9FLAO
MRYLTVFIICFLNSQLNYAQIYEVGVFAGGSNLIGDVGSSRYIAPNQPAFGGVFKWNRSPRHSYRLSVIFTDLDAKDSKSDDPRRIDRDYSFNGNLLEVALGMEFTFFDFNLHGDGNKSTPYIYTGISFAKHDNYYFRNGVQTSENTSSWATGIPMALGYKTTLTNHILIAAEIGARYTFSDELDGNFPERSSLFNYSFGNLNNNDWYMFTGITLTYTFARKPCYCDF